MEANLSPKYWRARAEEARAMAENMTYPEAKASLLRIAEGYERLAAMAEEIMTTKPKGAPQR